MSKTNAQLIEDNKKLQKELLDMRKLVDDQFNSLKELQNKNESLEKILLHKDKLVADLFSKYVNKSPEQVIVTILEEMEIPEQVATLKQINAKKLIQWREIADKHRRATKFFENNISDMGNYR